jgi:hypothetical protein
MKKRRFATEAELATVIVDYLKEWHWEVYQEVEGAGGRCDIMAKRGKILWAVECKLSFGLPVLEQAINWCSQAHYVSVAVPSDPSWVGRDILKRFGIGCLCVSPHVDATVQERVAPLLHRKIHPPRLYEEQKSHCAAGGNQGGHWSPFKMTVKNLVTAVRAKPGIEFKDLIVQLDHHYSSNASAKSSLLGFICGKVIPELKTETVNGKLCVFPA